MRITPHSLLIPMVGVSPPLGRYSLPLACFQELPILPHWHGAGSEGIFVPPCSLGHVLPVPVLPPPLWTLRGAVQWFPGASSLGSSIFPFWCSGILVLL